MQNTEEKLKLKQQLLHECLVAQKAILNNARNAMEEAHQNALDYDEQAEDNMVDSYREEMQNKRDMFARQFEAALDDEALLNKVTVDKIATTVSFGSVVITESQKLFISLSLGQIKVEGDMYFAVSPAAPLYKAMAGMKAGETFKFRDKPIKILDVF